ncbi:MAG: hypothetical protein WBY28_12245 [Nitrososphaeraceae archaeon]
MRLRNYNYNSLVLSIANWEEWIWLKMKTLMGRSQKFESSMINHKTILVSHITILEQHSNDEEIHCNAILTGALGMTVFAPTAANALSCAN